MVAHKRSGLSLIFEVGRDLQKIAGDSSCCSEVNMLVSCQSSRGYTSKYEGKIPGPWPLMTALRGGHKGRLDNIIYSHSPFYSVPKPPQHKEI